MLVPLLVFGFVAWQDRLAVLRNAQAGVENEADNVREHTNEVFQTAALIITLIDQRTRSMSWGEIESSKDLHDYLIELIRENPQIDAAWLVDADGMMRASSGMFPMPPTHALREPDFLTAARSSDALFIGRRIDDRDSAYTDQLSGSHFPIARRRRNADGMFDGVIVLKFAGIYFEDKWRKSWRDSAGKLAILANTNLEVLARVPAERNVDSVGPTGFLAAAIRDNSSEGSFRRVSSLDGIDRIYAYRRVIPYDAYIAYGMDVSSVLRTWYAHLLVYGGIFGLAALALGAISLVAAQRMQGERAAVAQWREANENLAKETEQRRVAEQQLFQLEKLEALGQVAGGFAHDIGNVLMAVHINLDTLRGRTMSEDDEATLSNAITEIERGSEAIRSLMIFARRGSLDVQVVDPKAQIEQMTGLLHQTVGAHATLEISIEGGLWSIEVNANQFELGLLNLAINARDAMSGGGKLRVGARNVSLAGTPDDLAGDFVEISVADTGCGMPPDIAAKAIEPFFTTKEEGKGTGLGLSQLYGFAKSCGGTMTLTSTVGRGTTVTLYIPKHIASEHRDTETRKNAFSGKMT